MRVFGNLMSRLRILFVSKSTGGLLTYMRWLASGLDLNRFQLTFVCLSEGGSDLAAELSHPPDIETLSWPMNRFRINPVTDAIIILRLFRLIRSQKYDLIHAHGSKAGFLARISAAGSGVPVIYSPHGFAFDAGNVSRFVKIIYALVEKLVANSLTARIITVSEAEQKSALAHGIGSPELFTIVHSGIESKHFDIPADRDSLRQMLGVPPDSLVVGTVGRLNEQKAPFDFVHLAARIKQSCSGTFFVWIGDGNLMESVRKLASQLGVDTILRFTGIRSDVISLLRGMDCFLLTSHWEAFPIVVLEAMASQLPVVAGNLPGVDEAIVDGINGYLYPVGDLDAMQVAVEKVIRDRELAAQFGLNGRKRILQSFTRQQMIQKLEDVYVQICNSRVQKSTSIFHVRSDKFS
jgi:glycosyltransferase involved in cell wall biosynthesis